MVDKRSNQKAYTKQNNDLFNLSELVDWFVVYNTDTPADHTNGCIYTVCCFYGSSDKRLFKIDNRDPKISFI